MIMSGGSDHQSPGPPSVFPPSSQTARFTFNVDETAQLSSQRVVAAPIDIPARSPRHMSQRHTNFTPPRSYLATSPAVIGMVRSRSAGSLSTAVTFLVGEQVHPQTCFGVLRPPGEELSERRHSEHLTPPPSSRSVPSFSRCAMELAIAQQLRDMSDDFNMEFAGFCHGYAVTEPPTHAYSSSYPGCVSSLAHRTSWQSVVAKLAPTHRPPQQQHYCQATQLSNIATSATAAATAAGGRGDVDALDDFDANA